MDIMMPEMDGYETMQVIRQNAKFRRLPIIALTAKAMKGDREKCLEAGATEYLAKPVNIEMVDDQPAKLLSYETVLQGLDENLIKASSGKQALEELLRTDIAVVLMDVSMPELDGFELAEIIHQHPRFQHVAIIFVSAVHLSDVDRIKGYNRGAVDYVSVPVIPEVLKAKVRVFVELHRKTRMLERLNNELEQRVAIRTEELGKRAEALELVNTELARKNQQL